MSGWCLKDNPHPYTYDKLPDRLTLYRTDHSECITYSPERTTTRGKVRTLLLNLWEEGSKFAYAQGSKKRWEELEKQLLDVLIELADWEFSNEYCPFCGRKLDECAWGKGKDGE